MTTTKLHKIIFVAGIHGVGKTSFCSKITCQISAEHVSASTLIKNAGAVSDDGKKRVDDVDKNQDVLIHALGNYQTSREILLLDGHFCVLDKRSNIVTLPQQTFVQIAPSAVIVLQGNTQTVQERMNQRDSYSFDVEFITKFQELERAHAEQICNDLGIPLLIIDADQNYKAAFDFIHKFLV